MADYFNHSFLAALGFPTRLSFNAFCSDYPDESRKLAFIFRKGAETILAECKAVVDPIKERIRRAEIERKERVKEEKRKAVEALVRTTLEKERKTEEQHQKELCEARKQAVEEYKKSIGSPTRPIEISSSPMIYKPRPPLRTTPPPSGTISCLPCRQKDLEITHLKASVAARDKQIAELKETITVLKQDVDEIEQLVLKRKRV